MRTSEDGPGPKNLCFIPPSMTLLDVLRHRQHQQAGVEAGEEQTLGTKSRRSVLGLLPYGWPACGSPSSSPPPSEPERQRCADPRPGRESQSAAPFTRCGRLRTKGEAWRTERVSWGQRSGGTGRHARRWKEQRRFVLPAQRLLHPFTKMGWFTGGVTPAQGPSQKGDLCWYAHLQPAWRENEAVVLFSGAELQAQSAWP